MEIKYIYLSLICMNGLVLQAQVDSLEQTMEDTRLEELVITSQIEPQSLKKAINNVRVISKEDIQNLGAVNLADVLNQYINITVTPDSSTGKSTVSMFGLDSRYFKILIDNVPLVSENGFGNSTDLSQINLNDVERVEIIEGSMGVTHGANAVSGVLNIITKKSSDHKWEFQLTAQEESVGKEFSFFNKGRHIQALKVNHNINDNWFLSVGLNRNDSKGFLKGQKGEHHDLNDGKRGYIFLPRQQTQGNTLINYSKDDLRVFYRFEFLDEDLQYYNRVVQSGYNEDIGAYKYGLDKRYFVNRLYHHLNASGKLFNHVNFNVSLSHQQQKREQETFRNNITHGIETLNVKEKQQSTDVIYSIGTFSNFFKSEIFNLQLGYEFLNTNGFSIVDELSANPQDVAKKLNNYDVFAITDINLNDRFSFRPGFRYSFQSIFENQYSYSLGGRYLLKNGFEFRAAIGQSYRTPDFDELYSRLIFDGHHFVGNEDLIPEKSNSLEASIKKVTTFSNNEKALLLSNNLMISRNDIKDRITSALIGFDGPTPMYQTINVSNYESYNFSSTNQLVFDNWKFNLGASLTLVSQVIDNLDFKSSDKFFNDFNFNSSVSYSVPSWKTTFAAYYKFIGKSQEWVAGMDEFVISERDSYSNLDASIRKMFWNNKFEATIGARNIFNVTTLNRSRVNEGGGHEVDAAVNIFSGRSYFVKLTYNLNFN
ncbi:TonB-dependent receptor plug domain-containing protein [Paenimyroides aestuarii]|uniref:TonB-dependent receptor n=1 Tax=Paenimyroides aestuarii TaxID=2968490 RepID=A0ABY5NSU5_9FLAO|nr:TonB-dependent receptor [Paenimyroides aestuarii]UUV21603.1 TonB-dependent receptor [Paenimyroides aestuarii]